jgi:hypothetical protein
MDLNLDQKTSYRNIVIVFAAIAILIIFLFSINYYFNIYEEDRTDKIPPSISDIKVEPSIADPDVGDIVNITCKILDSSGIFDAYINIEKPDEVLIKSIQLFDDGSHGDNMSSDGVFGNFWNTTNAETGFYYIDIKARDSGSHKNLKEVNNGGNISLIDSTGPSIIGGNIDPQNGNASQIFQINVNVIDSYGVLNVTAYIQNPDENNLSSLILYDDGAHGDGISSDTNYGNGWNSTGYGDGFYYIDIITYDNNFNKREVENIDGNFSIGDNFPPSVSNISIYPNIIEPSEIVMITANITDPSGISLAMAYIENPDETPIANIFMYDDGISGGDVISGDGNYTGQWDSLGQLTGTYYIDIRARDNSPVLNEITIDNGAILVINDTNGPTIFIAIFTPASGSPGQNFTIQANIADISGVYNVTAYIQFPDEVNNSTLILYDDGTHGDVVIADDIYTNKWDSTGKSTGTYYLDIFAIDNSPNKNSNESENADTLVLS